MLPHKSKLAKMGEEEQVNTKFSGILLVEIGFYTTFYLLVFALLFIHKLIGETFL